MITIRNPKVCQARSAIAGTGLKLGQVVKLAAGAAIGELPTAVSPLAADYDDENVFLGIVTWIPDDDLAVGYILDPTDRSLTTNTGADGLINIPTGARVVVWYDKPAVGFAQPVVNAALDVEAVREPTLVAFDQVTHTLAPYNGANADRDVAAGFVYMNDGAEVTVIFHRL